MVLSCKDLQLVRHMFLVLRPNYWTVSPIRDVFDFLLYRERKMCDYVDSNNEPFNFVDFY